jgi:hypothetical protein
VLVITYLRNENFIASLHAHRYPLSIFIKAAGPDGEDVGLVEFLDAALGQEDAAGGAGFGLDSLDQHAVQERDERLDGFQGGRLLHAGTEDVVSCCTGAR